MVQNDSWFECSDGTKLYLRRWLPDYVSPVRAIVHIVHGMAEHSGRYRRLAEKLSDAGIEVWAADHRGHGKTADLSINSPGKGGILGHCADRDTFKQVTADVHGINMVIQKIHPGIPLFLMGHSWGSFIAQDYIENQDNEGNLAGCILSGTRGPGGLKLKAGIPLMIFLTIVRGRRNSSRLARAAVDGPYNTYFRPNRTDFDWISRDDAEVDAYINDPFCGKICSTGFYRDMAMGLCRIHRDADIARISRDLPVYIFHGSADPVGDMGASPDALLNKYRSAGIKDIEFVLYSGARHEAINETNREEVMDNLLLWIQRHIDSPERSE
jgi:alpha-beta hydrolase superfamily lysophospholipase